MKNKLCSIFVYVALALLCFVPLLIEGLKIDGELDKPSYIALAFYLLFVAALAGIGLLIDEVQKKQQIIEELRPLISAGATKDYVWETTEGELFIREEDIPEIIQYLHSVQKARGGIR